MRNFILGILTTFGFLTVCGAAYNKGRESVLNAQKENTEKKNK